MKKFFDIPEFVIYTIVFFLFLAIFPLPYGYYIFLKIIVFSVFIIGAILNYEKNNTIICWLFLLFAVVFNPFIIIHLPREYWIIVDIIAIVFLLFITIKHYNSDN